MFRSKLPAGTELFVAKNTLVKKVIAGTPYEALGPACVGPNAFLFSGEDVASRHAPPTQPRAAAARRPRAARAWRPPRGAPANPAARAFLTRSALTPPAPPRAASRPSTTWPRR